MPRSSESVPIPVEPLGPVEPGTDHAEGSPFGRTLAVGAVIGSLLAGISAQEHTTASSQPDSTIEATPGSSATVEVDIPPVSGEVGEATEITSFTFKDIISFSSSGEGLNEYEIDYKTEQDDHAESQSQIAGFVSENPEAIRLAIEHNQPINVIGKASAEDDTPGGGYTVDDEPNAEGLNNPILALKGRGWPAAKALQAEVKSQLGLELPDDLLIVSGIEDEWTDLEEDYADHLAERFGYDSTEEMTDLWNRGPTPKTDFPPMIQNFLTRVLDQRRGFAIEVPALGGEDGASVDTEIIDPAIAERTPGVIAKKTKDIPARPTLSLNPDSGEATFGTVEAIVPPDFDATNWGQPTANKQPGRREIIDDPPEPEDEVVDPPPPVPIPKPRATKLPNDSKFRQYSGANSSSNRARIKQPQPNNFNDRKNRAGRGNHRTPRGRGGNNQR